MTLKTKYILFCVLSHISIMGPLRYLYLMENGISFTMIMLLTSLYNIGKILFALPVGSISDALGQKLFMVLGTFLKVMFYLILIFKPGSLIWLFLGYITISFGDSSLEYSKNSYLAHLTKENGGFKRTQGYISALSTILLIALNVIAGFLYEMNSIVPFWMITIIMIVPIFISLGMSNIYVPRSEDRIGYIKTIKRGADELKTNKKIKTVVTQSVILLVALRVIKDLKQPYLTSIGFGARELGTIGSLLELGTVLAGYNINSILKIMKNKLFPIGMAMITLTAFAIFGVHSKFGAIAYLVAPSLFVVVQISASSMIAKNSPKEITTTMFSFLGLLTSISTSVALVFMGPLVDNFGPHNTGLVIGIVLSFVILLISGNKAISHIRDRRA